MPGRVVVLAGGASSERDISLKSGAHLHQGAIDAGFDAALAVVDRPADVRRLDLTPADTALLALHGGFGEDGRVQAYLEFTGVPYSGAGPAASAVGMDKVLTKQLASSLGVRTADYVRLAPDSPSDYGGVAARLGSPFVVKARGQGCSVGLSLVGHEDEFPIAIKEASRHDRRVFAERLTRGVEVTVGLLDGELLPVTQIVYDGALFDHATKFVPGRSRYEPCSLPADVVDRLHARSTVLLEELEIHDLARVDFLVPADGEPVLLEINTLPGLAPFSVFLHCCAQAGLTYPEVVQRLVDGARRRRADRGGRGDRPRVGPRSPDVPPLQRNSDVR